MLPVICQIGPFSVYSYGLMLALGFLAGVYLARMQAKRAGFDAELIFNLSFFSLLCGIVGARLLYILENLSYYLQNPAETFMLQRGGLSWFGGFIAAASFAVIYLKRKKAPIVKTLDILAPFIALAQAIGRLGCFLNGCCFGKASYPGIYFPVHADILIPTQIYSSLALLVIFIITRVLQEKPHKAGVIFFSYLMLDSLQRFCIEFWRADNPPVFHNLTLFHFFSAAAFFFSVAALYLVKRRSQ